MFSKACEYAIKASIYIAQQNLSERRVNVKEIAHAIDAPEAFTAKILQQMCKAEVMQSVRGKQGGFYLSTEKMQETRIYDIITIIDGDSIFVTCGLGLKECSSQNPCPVHNEFRLVRERLIEMACKYTLADLAVRTEEGLFRLRF